MRVDPDNHLIPAVKILLIGNSSVGKSSLLVRFADDQFLPEEASATVGIDLKPKLVNIRGERLKLMLWDTAGSERFRSLTSSFYRGSHGVLLVYAIDKRDSFTQLNKWVNEIKTYLSDTDVALCVIGNKLDKGNGPGRQVTTEEGKALAESLDAGFLETSAKGGEGVDAAFRTLVERILDTPSHWDWDEQGRRMLVEDKMAKGTIDPEDDAAPAEQDGCAC